jgi:A/G-specific adenine glycosylase
VVEAHLDGAGDQGATLLAWGAAVRRDLPWRRTRDPWAILVAEVMAQQTQVERVVAKWELFRARWPDATSLAAAPLAEVLTAWSGLGYPRRARDLRRAAQVVRDEHGGAVPADLPSLLRLPGVGPYTARAVLAFAHEVDAAVVDTNVGRVLARRAGHRLTPAVAQRLADDWLPPGRSWEWNQTLLDLGAIVCRPAAPECSGCPVRPGCNWATAGRPEPDPATGSAGVSTPQATFDGSRRQARGRLLAAAGRGPVPRAGWVTVAGWQDRPDATAAVTAVVQSLVADGLGELDVAGAFVPPTR